MHHYQDVITLFEHCFLQEYRTRLIKGDEEPLYLPATEQHPYHAIFFAHGFFSSALHECAHWLIAGEARRKQMDYGYWYLPDGRNAQEQMLFMQAETKPQALEWILSKACAYPFRMSIDNLNGNHEEEQQTQEQQHKECIFKQAVYQKVMDYCAQGLPLRAKQFREALCHFYQTDPTLIQEQFDIRELDFFIPHR